MARSAPPPLRPDSRLRHRLDDRSRGRNDRARGRHGREERRRLRHEPALRRFVRHARRARASKLQNAADAAARAALSRVASGAHARPRHARTSPGWRIRPAAAFWIEGFHKAIDGDDGPEGRIVVLLEGSEALLERATRDLRSALGRAGVPETRVVDAGARESFERVVDAYIACLGERSVTYRLYPFPHESERCALRSARRSPRRFELRTETIVDVMNGDVVLRVSELDARAFGAKIENFDDALHELEPRAQVVASKHPSSPISARLGRGARGDRADARAQSALRSQPHAEPRPLR